MFKYVFIGLIFVVQSCTAQPNGWRPLMQWVRTSFPSVTQMSTTELAQILESSTATKPLLLDVRRPDEFAVSHLKNAQNIHPDATSFPTLNTTPRNTPIVVYCSVGYRSSALAQRLKDLGFTHVKNLEGSIFKWANENKPVYRNNRQVQDVHPFDSTWGRLLNRKYRTTIPR